MTTIAPTKTPETTAEQAAVYTTNDLLLDAAMFIARHHADDQLFEAQRLAIHLLYMAGPRRFNDHLLELHEQLPIDLDKMTEYSYAQGKFRPQRRDHSER